MNNLQTKAQIIEQLTSVRDGVAATVQSITPEQFDNGTAQAWSAASYLKHLILSVKPFAKAMNLPKEQLNKMFDKPDRPSHTFEELTAMYKQRLAEGIRAEDFDAVTPVTYRMPEGVENVKDYLVDVWNDSNNRVLTALESWDESELDTYQLPHPAVGLITMREMLFFTVYHNNLHWRDIQAAGAAV